MANGTTDNTAVNRLIDLAQQRPVEADDTLFESQKRIPLPPVPRARRIFDDAAAPAAQPGARRDPDRPARRGAARRGDASGGRGAARRANAGGGRCGSRRPGPARQRFGRGVQR